MRSRWIFLIACRSPVVQSVQDYMSAPGKGMLPNAWLNDWTEGMHLDNPASSAHISCSCSKSCSWLDNVSVICLSCALAGAVACSRARI